jgi:hypothetical protein
MMLGFGVRVVVEVAGPVGLLDVVVVVVVITGCDDSRTIADRCGRLAAARPAGVRARREQALEMRGAPAIAEVPSDVPPRP